MERIDWHDGVQRQHAVAEDEHAERNPWPFVLLMSAVALAATLVASRHGAAVAPDSVTYVSTARNLAHGRGLTDFTGHPLVIFGPGFSVLLAGGELIGVHALTVARLTNAAAAALIVVLAFVLLRRHVKHRAVLFAATASIALSTALLRVDGYVATDPIFLVVALAFLIAISASSERVKRWRGPMIVAALLVWVAFMLRYAGASLLVAGVFALAWSTLRLGRRAAVTRTLSFAALASLVPIAWGIRNLGVPPGEPLGFRVHSGEGPWGIAQDLLRGAVHLVMPNRISTGASVGVLVALAAVIGVWVWRSRREFGPALRGDPVSVAPLAIFVVVYVVFVTVARKTTGSDLDPRILMPAFLPMVVLAAWFVDHLLRVERAATLRRTLIVFVAIGLAASSVWFARQINVGVTALGYETQRPSNVVLARVLERIPPSTLVVSNDPWRIYAVSRRQPVELAPMKVIAGFSHRPMTGAALTKSVCRQTVVLLWFSYSPASGTHSISAFTRRAGGVALTNRAHFPTGDRYKLTAQHCGG